MPDFSDLFDVPRALTVGALRVLWWLAWDFCIETVGWSIGWLVLRSVTLGRCPRTPLHGLDNTGRAQAAFVESLGLATLAACLWLLTGHLPD